MTEAPYGRWTSPISVADLTAGVIGLSETLLDGDRLYWLESRPDEGGRVTVACWCGGTRTELTPGNNVRTRVHEYGGGAYHVRDGVLVFSEFTTGQLWVLAGEGLRPITPEGSGWRFGDLRVHPDRDLVLAVREDDTGSGEPVNTIVALQLGSSNDDGGRVICSGADFYASPELGSDGRLAWVEWDHPNLPWDATRLMTGQLGEPGRLVAGGLGESAVAPRWHSDGELAYLSDADGFWNLYLAGTGSSRAVTTGPSDLTGPLWVLGGNPYALIDADQAVVAPIIDGRATPHRLDLATGRLTDLGFDWSATGYLTAGRGRVAAVAGYPSRPAEVVTWELDRDPVSQRIAAPSSGRPGSVSLAEAVTWSGPQGPVHGWFYPPVNPDFTAPAGELPPLIVRSHGGPTAMATSDFSVALQFWTSRGFAILDVNYGGSSGYGRVYRERLSGLWGVVDVADCVTGALALAEAGRVDRRRMAIKGGSAGGYTTLRALTTSSVFAAGVSYYGVGDLVTLATDTHKFESRYLDGLVGPWPEAAELYRERSPINHIDALNCPMLILQGKDDLVVPRAQAEAMAAAVAAKGLPVDLVLFDGEGHGFRKAETIQAAANAELAFYLRVLLPPALP